MQMMQNTRTAMRAAMLMMSCCFFENNVGFGGFGCSGSI